MGKLSDDELTAVRKMIDQHVRGLPADGDEWVEAHRKPLTYGELVELRKILRERAMNRAADAGVKVAKQAVGMMETLLSPKSLVGDTYSPRPKTSALLYDAARLINNAVKSGSQEQLPLFFGQDWKLLIDQLRERAAAFEAVEER